VPKTLFEVVTRADVIANPASSDGGFVTPARLCDRVASQVKSRVNGLDGISAPAGHRGRREAQRSGECVGHLRTTARDWPCAVFPAAPVGQFGGPRHVGLLSPANKSHGVGPDQAGLPARHATEQFSAEPSLGCCTPRITSWLFGITLRASKAADETAGLILGRAIELRTIRADCGTGR
jgi:hypothetical protein